MDSETLNEINLLRSHVNEALKIADRLTQKSQAGVSTPANRRKRGLTDEQTAMLLAKKNRKLNVYQIR